MKQIFFVGSFGSIYRRVLPLMDEKKKEGEIIVVTANESIYKFFKSYTDFSIIKTKVNPSLIDKKTWYMVGINLIRSKFEYRKLFKDFEDCNVYFFSVASKILMYNYIQKLAKKNHIFCYSSIKEIIKDNFSQNLKSKIIAKIIKVILGIDVSLRNEGQLFSISLNEKFFEKNKVVATYKEFDMNIYKKYMKNEKILKGKEVLVLFSDLVSYNQMNEDVVVEQVNQFIDIMDKYYPNKYIIKPHPVIPKLYGKMRDKPVLDSFVPSQFFMSHHWKIVIADCSAALVFPEEQNLNGVKLIELVDILKFKKQEAKEEFKKFLSNWNPNLLFPKTFEEFEEMIK